VSATLQAADGEVALLIPSPDGELHAYALRRAERRLAYRLSRDRSGRWRCSCPAARYAKGGAPCKHQTHARSVIEWAEALLGR
jgi:hypothetical protein